ncbi:lymphocyte expansion molecule isoform X4 [Ornithorhynchus anatinus]|uniref:lymphocyte expansion molecule isoform X4 n=1 Tax=Ornithorhynchus anatinus TaxID=9258 RepID=UPI0010A9269B|nr:lymphocyte expansion molecule isoform X4 [Ornithorhynchus anatinus]
MVPEGWRGLEGQGSGVRSYLLGCEDSCTSKDLRAGTGMGTGTGTGTGWIQEQESSRLTRMPHFRFKEALGRNRLLAGRLGPSTYQMKDFLELRRQRPGSTRGLLDSGEQRFRAFVGNHYPGPGSYGKGGNPYTELEEKARCSPPTQGIMSSKTKSSRSALLLGSGLGPGTYRLQNSIDALLSRTVSTRGPYDLFSRDRAKPIPYGHFATPKRKPMELGPAPLPNLLADLSAGPRAKYGTFRTTSRSPRRPPERMFWAAAGQGSCVPESIGPSSYNPQPIGKKEFSIAPPFGSSAKRVERHYHQLFMGNTGTDYAILHQVGGQILPRHPFLRSQNPGTGSALLPTVGARTEPLPCL